MNKAWWAIVGTYVYRTKNPKPAFIKTYSDAANGLVPHLFSTKNNAETTAKDRSYTNSEYWQNVRVIRVHLMEPTNPTEDE